MPQLNETERALMALLQKERERNGAVQAAEPPLPELDPSMFLSPAAQREVAAFNIPTISAPLVSEVIHATRREILASLSGPASSEIDLSVSSDWDITDNDLEPPRYAAEEVAPDLANLFMDRALRETGGTAGDQRRAERLGQDVEFSFTATDFEIDDMPRRYEAPRSSGGVEVARRGPGGFQQLSRAEAVARSEARAESRSMPQQRQASVQPQAPQMGKSRYERLLGPSIID